MTWNQSYKWLLLGFALLLIASSGLFFISWRPDWPKLIIEPIWNLGHVGLFALWAAVLAQIFKINNSLQSNLLAGLPLLFVGGVIEMLQPLFGRQAEWLDVGLDALGVVLGLLFYHVCCGGKTSWRLPLVLFLLLGATLTPVLKVVMLMHQQQQLLPLIWDAEHADVLPIRFTGSANTQLKSANLQVQFTTKRYSTLHVEAVPRDWRAYSALELDLDAKEPFKLSCRIHDRQHEQGVRPYRYHDRYTQSFMLKPGRQILHIDLQRVQRAPQKREMQMGQIRQLICFSYQLQQPRKMVLYSLKFVH